MNNSNLQKSAASGFADGNVVNVSSYAPDLNRPYVVKNWFQPGRVGMLIAPPAHGKTAIVAAICAYVAMGRPFAGQRILRNSVYYIAPEDAQGVMDRAYGHIVGVPKGSLPFYVVDKAPDLRDESHVSGIVSDVRKMKAKSQTEHAIVVIDTLNRAIGDADENSSSAAGAIVANAERVAREAACYVLLVHHTPHGNAERGRGSSAFLGNTDDTFLLKRDKQSNARQIVRLVPLKQKGVPLQSAIAFEIEAFKVGHDTDRDEVTVPKANPLDKRDTVKIPTSNLNKAPKSKSNAQERQDDMLRVLEQLGQGATEAWHEIDALKTLAGDPFNNARNKADSLATAVRRSLATLENAGAIEKRGRSYRLALAAKASDEAKS
ncbi:AAA family ATPase [Ruegeria atlantica]|uniref:AAA family ATPase n=1 Tax=Ruegeria atlantica TaxID=81569 RepID=UPI00147EC66D|nr:AAA family ATPase [Ruegeria atlantica]